MKLTSLSPFTPSPAPRAAAAPTHDKVARDFEAAMLTPMVEEMLRTATLSGEGQGAAQSHWRSFLAGAIAGQIADSGQTGIARSVTQALIEAERGAVRG